MFLIVDLLLGSYASGRLIRGQEKDIAFLVAMAQVEKLHIEDGCGTAGYLAKHAGIAIAQFGGNVESVSSTLLHHQQAFTKSGD